MNVLVGADVAGHSQAARAAMLGPGDVVIGVSHSGTSKDVVTAVHIAKEQGARVIALTHVGKSHLTKLSDVALQVSSRETAFRTEAMSSRIAMFSLMDAVFVALALRRYETAVSNIQRVRLAHRGSPGEADVADLEVAARTAVQSAAGNASSVAVCAVTSQMAGLVLLDAEGQAVGPSLTWQDRRADVEAAEIAAELEVGVVL